MSGNCNSGRKPKYLTIEKFEKFLSNDWYHLKRDLFEVKWVVRVGTAALITWALIDRLVG